MTVKQDGSLIKLAIGGVTAGIFGKVVNVILGILTIAILARILSPYEYGEFGFVAICLAIGQVAPQSVTNAIVGQKEVLSTDISSGFTLIVLLSLVFSGLLVLCRNVVSAFFSVDISNLILFAAVVLPFLSVSAFLDGILSKGFEFKKNALFDFVSVFVGQTLITVALAWFGFGAWALLIGMAMSGFVRLTMQLSTGSARHLMLTGISPELTRRSWWFFLSNTANYLGRNADNLIVARMLGVESLGIYQRAFNLMMRPVQLFGGAAVGVFYPLMSTIQYDKPRLRYAYLRAVVATSAVGMPMSFFLFFNGGEIVEIVFGEKWLAVAAPFQILALCLYFRLTYRISDISILSLGAVRAAGGMQVMYALMIATGSALGLRWGVVGIATGVGVALGLYFLASVCYANRLVGVSLGDFLKAQDVAIAVTIFYFSSNFILKVFMPERLGAIGDLLLSGGAFSSGYAMAFVLRWLLFRRSISLAVLDDVAQLLWGSISRAKSL